MKFNNRELALYASSRFGKADKEGCLWMKEAEGILKKKESELLRLRLVASAPVVALISFPRDPQPIHRDGSY